MVRIARGSFDRGTPGTRYAWTAALAIAFLSVVGSCDKIVTPEPPDTPLTISSGDQTLTGVGSSVQLTTNGAVGPVQWSSSDPAVAEVAITGFLTAEGPGTATITASNLGRSASIVATVTDQAPVASAGEDRIVAVGGTAVLDGSGSLDPEGRPLAWSWTLVSAPAGSGAALQDADQPTALLAPDVEGAFLVRLIVSDGFQDSPPDEVTVTGIVPVAACQLSPSNLAFGVVPTSGGSEDRTFTIRNSGDPGDLSIGGSVSESCATFQLIAGAGAFTLGPGEEHDITVRFTPTTATPGDQSCVIQTEVPECPSLLASGTGGVSFAEQILPTIESCTGACHTGTPPSPSHDWVLTVTNPANPEASELLTFPPSASHTGQAQTPDDWNDPDSLYYRQLVAWIMQGQLDD